ncbi:ParB/Srx family N-terminal domain-containing protein [Endozoicomonas gorgoniicola]|uniref:ParB/Srx family N-terminal domain-containing protein n=1 Tax=Endozoicomonas gorgoniicola TaxID=1234144 RepID=A0ABT3MV94_9GAMM|nr:ParB/Srx family N-terminal domain-containing protein [Endozoicomonas gorgoniicola]MCW7553311.1 ParB/Srx family N-terminal domain-containing protein [Endozoicomonas gorgoniicola]
MTAKKYKLVDKKVGDLIPYVNNSRVHDDEQVIQICSSIREFGFTNPVLIDEDNGIIAGHGRLMAAKKLELKTVPCIILAGLSDAQKKAYVIADNAIALNSSWDMDKLSLEVEALQAEDFDLEVLGFRDDFLVSLYDEPPQPDEQEKPEEQYSEIFNIIVECDSEDHQQAIYDELTGRGYKCRVQSL